MTILQKYRGAIMDTITSFVNNPENDPGRSRQRNGGRRRRTEVSSRASGRAAPPPRDALERAIEDASHVERRTPGSADAKPRSARDRSAAWTPRLVIAPAALASFVYVFVFTVWTLYISLSN